MMSTKNDAQKVLIEPWIKILDQALNIVLTPTQFSPGVLLILQERYNVL